MGQILSEESDQDKAIDYLIDSLRWDSKNSWALLMMGNIFAKYKNDITTAMKYYDQAVVANPNDNIAVNNIGANLMQQGKIDDAKKYFWEAIKINAEYPNTHFALGMIALMENDLGSAFYSTCKAIKLSKAKDGLYQNAVAQAIEVAQKITKGNQGQLEFTRFLKQLEEEGGTKIEYREDNDIPTAAKFEFAENYDRTYHQILFRSGYPSVEHLMTHELVHLQFVLEARKKDQNLLFISNQSHRSNFLGSIEPAIRNLKKMGIPEDAIRNYSYGLFDGINRQVYNTPIDLFIEDLIYVEFPDLRPYQFLSLYALIQEGLKAVTDKRSIEISPREILSKSKILNLVNAIQYKMLYGIDFIGDFKASQNELGQAQQLYHEYLEYKDDKEPGEEYELVVHWAEDLNLDKNFELVKETEFRAKRTSVDDLLKSIEEDPYDLKSNDPYKKVEMDQFIKSEEKIGTNMAVVMFMVDALQFFYGMSKEKIVPIAYEIALEGTHGFRPDGKNYGIKSIPEKLFSGYHILAYYYVSWKLGIPEMIDKLQLPYDDEYKLAITLFKPKDK